MQFDKHMFASCLKEWREKAQITQIEMAALLNITQSHVSKYETGRRNLDLETFLRWVRVTNSEANAAVVMFGADIFTQVSTMATLIPAYAQFMDVTLLFMN